MATVLVVDDRPVNRDLVRTILGYEGYDVLEAESGPEALRMLRSGRADLVISDVLMPGMDGYELAREIRATPDVRELPIVFYTANYLEQEARPIAAACGVEHIVAKDGDPRALIDAVTAALHGGNRRPPEVPDEDFSREHLRVLNAKLLEKVRELEEKQRLAQLVDAAIVVSGDLGLQTTLDRIAFTARALLAAGYASVTIRDDADFEIGAAHDGVAPAIPDPSVPSLSVVLTAKDGQHGQLQLIGKQTADTFTDNDERLLLQFADAATAAIANAHRFDDAQRRQAWLRAAAEVTALLLGADPSDALPTIVARARTVANAAVAWIEPVGAQPGATESVDPDAAPASPTVAGAPGRLGRSAAALGAQLVRRVAAAGAPVTIDDAAAELSSAGQQAAALDGMVGDLDGLGALLAVPMQGREDLLGVLILGNRHHSRPFTALDVEMATTFAGQAAVAVEFARAQSDRERLRVVEERHRIARDLHDIVIQRLFATGLRLENLAGTLPEAPALQIRDATGELDRTIDDIREAIFSLRNATQPPLRRQLLAVITRVQRSLGFAPTVVIDEDVDDAVPEELWPFLVATINEALTNVARHAGASRAEVVVSVRGPDLVVRVADDGCGLPGQRVESGLANLRHRAELAGGRMTTEPGPDGRGLVLTSRVPLPPE
jgi:signal transduction histidine kinase/DNA-binding response OmpR family regulator